MASSSWEEQQQPVKEKECVHKTKTIQFLGRTTPIILQNDNGPCPLLAICNVLLLKNNFDLGSDSTEVSQQKLLTLVAEKLIDLNSNTNSKDEEYVENQQQNISDAIDLLPQLTTGIDVNLKFKRIDDFEFTPECAIFDLLGIPLYHGWIVDPQDKETAEALGSKSYNALMGELVALETENMEATHKINPEEDDVDFVAATTATLGVPSPSLSNSRSFDESPRSAIEDQKERKGDLEEEAELLKVLEMSESEMLPSVGDSVVADLNIVHVSSSLDECSELDKVTPMPSAETLKKHDVECNNLNPPDPTISHDCNAFRNEDNLGEAVCLPLKTEKVSHDHSIHVEPTVHSISVGEKSDIDSSVQIENAVCTGVDITTVNKIHADVSQVGKKIDNTSFETKGHKSVDKNNEGDTIESCLSAPKSDTDSSSIHTPETDASETLTSTIEGSEPIYEGEECILSPGTTALENREPVYEGEVVLTEQADKGTAGVRPKDEITPQEGELIRNFLKNNASQLTFYGLFCLQDGLKERELCVFFRNNHFSTMFKFNGELYILATDQGYINQPDLVWEKLNETKEKDKSVEGKRTTIALLDTRVNGDTLFMTSNFKEFKVENLENGNWDENHAMASTADYLANIDTAAQASSDINSDLQLAIALQQQEFDQQPQRQSVQQSSATSNSRLITGPQGPRNGGRSSTISASSRPEAKSKDKCTVM